MDGQGTGANADREWQALLPAMLRQAGLPDGPPLTVVPLTGGVSSDIVRVRLSDGTDVAAKRALSQLKTASEWRASTERNHSEAEWLRQANAIVPGAAPRVLAEDRASGTVLLEYLPPEDFAVWKAQLLAGRVDPAIAVAVADTIGRIHAATLGRADVAATFATDILFDQLRLDPYLRYLAGRYPDLAGPILQRLADTASHRMALVHGDLSPKNILVANGDRHPVILDAECAWYGDPAFDAAFCVNHLILKAVHMPAHAGDLKDSAARFLSAWLAHFDPEPAKALSARTAALLPCLMLARVDGKSPAEYLTARDMQTLRDVSIPLIAQPPAALDAILEALPA